jgi:hypothetical protein
MNPHFYTIIKSFMKALDKIFTAVALLGLGITAET